jgi:DNA-directed RNA polymerase specialized sigma24 family protein
MTPLDQRLYAWLSEADEKRFARAFNAYFAIAFPAVVRYLTRISHWDPAQLEELAQDALLRFFDRIGRGRRQAAEAIATTLPTIRPLPWGVFHERQVREWTRQVGTFRDEAIAFRPVSATDPEDRAWKALIDRITAQIPGLVRQGLHLLQTVRLEIRWDALEPSGNPEEESADFASCFQREFSIASPRATAAALHCPALVPFVSGTSTVTEALPKLRVPTNGYLFEMAMTIYLDECKKRGRIKRGGTGERHAPTSPPDDGSIGAHPLQDSDWEDESGVGGGYAFGAGEGVSFRFHPTAAAEIPVADPTLQFEHTEFLEKFYKYLRQPVEEAANACLQAQAHGKATAERARLDSLTRKLDRTLAVLSLMGEGNTQEETAAELNLTRNQVKYIVEKVQEAYAQFTARHQNSPAASAGAGATHHA